MIAYEGTLFRPPSEANSLILQATIGCSYNQCTFCAMYREKRFRVRPMDELLAEIEWARQSLGPVHKVFLADGDALVAKARFLAELCDVLRGAFPDLRRISCYASPQSMAIRSVEEMSMLREKGLTQYYLGIESGHDQVLSDLAKGVDAEEMIRVANKAHEAGVVLSTMILLGAGGRQLSQDHARESARVVNAIQPRFLSTLVMTPVEGTPLGDQDAQGEVDELNPVELAAELRELIVGLECEATIFRSNHASNTLTLAGVLPKDKPALLGILDETLAHPSSARFVPRWRRGL
ncbi:MAG: radical SAM protein [Planctomycetes bacterium]|nr:radical SAM protein [Planctomycetota bacterium]